MLWVAALDSRHHGIFEALQILCWHPPIIYGPNPFLMKYSSSHNTLTPGSATKSPWRAWYLLWRVFFENVLPHLLEDVVQPEGIWPNWKIAVRCCKQFTELSCLLGKIHGLGVAGLGTQVQDHQILGSWKLAGATWPRHIQYTSVHCTQTSGRIGRRTGKAWAPKDWFTTSASACKINEPLGPQHWSTHPFREKILVIDGIPCLAQHVLSSAAWGHLHSLGPCAGTTCTVTVLIHLDSKIFKVFSFCAALSQQPWAARSPQILGDALECWSKAVREAEKFPPASFQLFGVSMISMHKLSLRCLMCSSSEAVFSNISLPSSSVDNAFSNQDVWVALGNLRQFGASNHHHQQQHHHHQHQVDG